MADDILPMSGFEAFSHLSQALALNVNVTGVEHVPGTGAFLVAPNHPTGIADGIAVFDALKAVRKDLMFFANRDAVRISENLAQIIIPVEWRDEYKTRAKTRDSLLAIAKAMEAARAVVLFPAGRIAYWHEGALTERPWQDSLVSLAKKYQLPIVPMNIRASNSGLFYFVSRFHDELRDITLFRELLNKSGQAFEITIGAPVLPEQLAHPPSLIIEQLQHYCVNTLAADANTRFDMH